MAYKFTPEDGFLNETEYPDGADETENRTQHQSLHSQTRDYVNDFLNYYTDTGTANALVITPDPAFTSYAANMTLLVKINVANTGASTINVNGLGTKAIKKYGSTDLIGGDLSAGNIVLFKYDGTNFQIIGETAAGAQAKVNAYAANNDGGWTDSKETWVYASPTSFTVTGDVTNKYAKGDKFSLIANGVELFTYAVNVSYSSPNTTITVVGNTLTNHTFSNCFYSKSNNPTRFPDWFSYTPSVSYGGGTTDPTSTTINEAIFKIASKECIFMIKSTVVRGSGNRSYVNFSLPVTSSLAVNHAAMVYQELTTTQSMGVLSSTTNVSAFLGSGMATNGVVSVAGSYRI